MDPDIAKRQSMNFRTGPKESSLLMPFINDSHPSATSLLTDQRNQRITTQQNLMGDEKFDEDLNLFAFETRIRKMVLNLIEPSIKRQTQSSDQVKDLQTQFLKIQQKMDECELIITKAARNGQKIDGANRAQDQVDQAHRMKHLKLKDKIKTIQGLALTLEKKLDIFENERQTYIHNIEHLTSMVKLQKTDLSQTKENLTKYISDHHTQMKTDLSNSQLTLEKVKESSDTCCSQIEHLVAEMKKISSQNSIINMNQDSVLQQLEDLQKNIISSKDYNLKIRSIEKDLQMNSASIFNQDKLNKDIDQYFEKYLPVSIQNVIDENFKAVFSNNNELAMKHCQFKLEKYPLLVKQISETEESTSLNFDKKKYSSPDIKLLEEEIEALKIKIKNQPHQMMQLPMPMQMSMPQIHNISPFNMAGSPPLSRIKKSPTGLKHIINPSNMPLIHLNTTDRQGSVEKRKAQKQTTLLKTKPMKMITLNPMRGKAILTPRNKTLRETKQNNPNLNFQTMSKKPSNESLNVDNLAIPESTRKLPIQKQFSKISKISGSRPSNSIRSSPQKDGEAKYNLTTASIKTSKQPSVRSNKDTVEIKASSKAASPQRKESSNQSQIKINIKITEENKSDSIPSFDHLSKNNQNVDHKNVVDEQDMILNLAEINSSQNENILPMDKSSESYDIMAENLDQDEEDEESQEYENEDEEDQEQYENEEQEEQGSDNDQVQEEDEDAQEIESGEKKDSNQLKTDDQDLLDDEVLEVEGEGEEDNEEDDDGQTQQYQYDQYANQGYGMNNLMFSTTMMERLQKPHIEETDLDPILQKKLQKFEEQLASIKRRYPFDTDFKKIEERFYALDELTKEIEFKLQKHENAQVKELDHITTQTEQLNQSLLSYQRKMTKQNLEILDQIQNFKFLIQNFQNFIDMMASKDEFIAESFEGIIEAIKIQCILSLADEEDRNSISLLGVKEEIKQGKPQHNQTQILINSPNSSTNKVECTQTHQPIAIDRTCLSCSSQQYRVISAFKMACLSYFPSPVIYQKNEFTRKNLIKTEIELLKKTKQKIVKREQEKDSIKKLRTTYKKDVNMIEKIKVRNQNHMNISSSKQLLSESSFGENIKPVNQKLQSQYYKDQQDNDVENQVQETTKIVSQIDSVQSTNQDSKLQLTNRRGRMIQRIQEKTEYLNLQQSQQDVISSLNHSEFSMKKLQTLEDSKLYQTQRFSNRERNPNSGESSVMDNQNNLNNTSTNLITFNSNALLMNSNTNRIHSHRASAPTSPRRFIDVKKSRMKLGQSKLRIGSTIYNDKQQL
ncbi:UNKNOWN [Stylonychia lemnae]|uniref:Uncharacterized protein n=1 Tax=Stylonychia lemnae TaxID=5949 RepID=A0A077ZQ20_STYLE|nr:UNKNOWN [Stylonychia lemnae]|eukprot:CDW71559.1 UNKNOWN [Stylonychia lemnae]